MKFYIHSQMRALAETEKDTIYFQGIKQIEDTMQEILKSPKSRVVVFIDDVDRRFPKKALEVLESVKVLKYILK